MDQSSIKGDSDIFSRPEDTFELSPTGPFRPVGSAPAPRQPDLADVMAAAERLALAWTNEREEFEELREETFTAAAELTRVVNAVRAAQGQPPIGEPAYQPCPGPGPEGE